MNDHRAPAMRPSQRSPAASIARGNAILNGGKAYLAGWLAIVCLLVTAGCDQEPEARSEPASKPAATDTLYPVTINRPTGPPTVDSGLIDLHGKPAPIACATCHDLLEPNPELHSGEQLEAFHEGLSVAHGEITCLSCHNADNYDQLRLADGRAVEFTHVMKLCGQCHGPQQRDFGHGAHGGMTGYWDLRRGPRQRNNCIDCHDPHSPAFPAVTPVFPPRDGLPYGLTDNPVADEVQP